MGLRNKFELEFHVQRIKSFYEEQQSNILVSVIASTLLFLYYWDRNSKIQIMWIIAHLITNALRLYTSRLKTDKKNLLKSEDRYATLSGIVGLLWGSVIYIFLPISKVEEVIIPVLVPIAVTVGGNTKMQISIKSCLSFVVSAVVFYLSYFILYWNNTSLYILPSGVLLLIFLVQATIKSYRTYSSLQISFYEKSILLNEAHAKLALEEELKKQKMQSVHNAKLASLGEMAGGVAHEINNPLHIIRMQTKLILKRIEKEKNTNEQTKQNVDKIVDTVDRIAKIINGLLLFSREQQTNIKSVTTINEIIDDALSISQEKFRASGVQIINEALTDNLVEVNKIAISQVIINLLNNSYFFIKSFDDPWIKISIESETSHFIEISFTDCGNPIDKETQAKLFEPFFSTKPHGEGSGLGLSISKGILHENGCDLKFIEREHPCFSIIFKKHS